MEVTATAKYVRSSPGKARDLARRLRGLPVADALAATQFSERKMAFLIGKALKSAIANAEHNEKMALDKLWVKEAVIDEGPSLKRYRARARGAASRILKRTCHIRIVLTDTK